MQVILTKDIHPLGQKGQAVKVRPGYFRNFLFPNGIAVNATKKLIVKAEELNQKIAEEQAKARMAAERTREELKGKTINLKEKLTKKGTLYSKISAKEVAEALQAQLGVKVDTNAVNLKNAIKTTGDHEVELKLTHGVVAKVKLSIEGVE
jgi:large subunit ribosomal protein L9